ncbi:MAG: class I SAM-dependent methyltransferase [Pseudomonadota bacterium]
MTAHSAIVADGYDQISSAYLAWSEQSAGRLYLQDTALRALRPGSKVLELGCGAGLPLTAALAGAGLDVTGIDISPCQINAARQNVPSGSFHCADIVEFDFGVASYDAVVAAFSLGHVPAQEHGALYRRIARALRVGGLLFASLCQTSNAGSVAPDWLGAEMYFSHPSLEDSLRLISDAGLVVRTRKDITEPYDGDAVFTWIAAEKER